MDRDKNEPLFQEQPNTYYIYWKRPKGKSGEKDKFLKEKAT